MSKVQFSIISESFFAVSKILEYYFRSSLSHSLTHGAEPFLRSRQLCRYSRTSQHFMEAECSLSCPHSHFKSHMKSSRHRLIPFLPLFCSFQLNSTPRSSPIRLTSRNSVLDFRLLFSTLQVSESESYVTTDGQSASLSWYKAPIRGLRPDFYFRMEYGIRLDSLGRPL
jgi:hypothetical protein